MDKHGDFRGLPKAGLLLMVHNILCKPIDAAVLVFIHKLSTSFQNLMSRQTDGYDVVDFRVGTLIGTVVLMIIPLANAHFDEKIPDFPAARTVQILVQIATIILSYHIVFIKRWANEIGNLFSFLFALQLILFLFRYHYPIQETAVTVIILFALHGMFKTKRALTAFAFITDSLAIGLCWFTGTTPLSKSFMTAIGSLFFFIGFYVFFIRLDYLHRLTRRERELEKSEMWFRSIFDNAPVGIVMLDEAFNGFRFNTFFQNLVGFTEGELLAMGWKNLINAEDYLTVETLKKALTQKDFFIEQRFSTKNNEPIWIRTRFSPMIMNDKNYTIAMMSDIRTQKEVAQQLQKSADLLRAQNDTLEEFTYVISHDLQEPLRMITSFTQIIQRRHLPKLNDEEANRDFTFVIDGAKRMSTLIRDMLEYSRWSARTLPVERVNVLEALSEAMQNLTVAVSRSNAEVSAADELPTIVANRHMLVQVFQNLISNAIKYRHAVHSPRIDIHLEKRENDWLFSFQDNGAGFNNRYRERIFGIFQRLQTQRATGNGIGLAICKRIIERQGGQIWADSTVGKGSVFQFTLPFIAAEGFDTEEVEWAISEPYEGFKSS